MAGIGICSCEAGNRRNVVPAVIFGNLGKGREKLMVLLVRGEAVGKPLGNFGELALGLAS